MKTVDDIRAKLTRRYEGVWAEELVSPGDAGWPYSVNVGAPTRVDLEASFSAFDRESRELATWAEGRGLECRFVKRKAGRVSYPILSHVSASDVEHLARAVGMSPHLQRYRERLGVLRKLFPLVADEDAIKALRLLDRDGTDDVDFDLTCEAALWFAAHDAKGFTPREVPLEGFHAKWLDALNRRKIICLLTGQPSLALKERPRLIRFHYLDSAYLATGLRAHDSLLEGDTSQPAYVPRVVLICENRDNALWFPSVEGGIAVLGDGKAGISTLVGVPWIANAERLFYWGDMDIQGFEILAKYREAGLDVESILMDWATYAAYERFGTNVDTSGRVLKGKDQKAPAAASTFLTDEENELYFALCSPDCSGPRRIEQERIPLDVARTAILTALRRKDTLVAMFGDRGNMRRS